MNTVTHILQKALHDSTKMNTSNKQQPPRPRKVTRSTGETVQRQEKCSTLEDSNNWGNAIEVTDIFDTVHHLRLK